MHRCFPARVSQLATLALTALSLLALPYCRAQSPSGADAAAAFEAEQLVNVEDVLRLLRPGSDSTSVEQSEEDAWLLADVRVQHLSAAGAGRVRVQQLTYVVTAAGVHGQRQAAIRYAPDFERLRIIQARIHKPDGRTVPGVEGAETQVYDAAAQMYYDLRSRALRFPALRAGDVIELDYELVPLGVARLAHPHFGELIAFRGDLRRDLRRYAVISPETLPLYAHQERMQPARVRSREGVRLHSWEAHRLAALPREPRRPAAVESGPYLHVSTFASWEELGAWYAELLRPQLEPPAALSSIVRRLVRRSRNELETVHAIHEWVLRNTRYVALEFGIHSHKPYSVAQTLERRFGDCKDKAGLMVAMLRLAGIEAEMALLRTRPLGEIHSQPASLAVFDHAIVRVPAFNLWLDGTADYSGSRELPVTDQGAMALTVSAEGATGLHRLPASGAEDNFTRREMRVQINASGAMRFSGSFHTRGERAPRMRRIYEPADRRLESVRAGLAQVFPAVRVDQVAVDGADDLEHDLAVSFQGAVETFAGRGSVLVAASWDQRSQLAELVPSITREADLVLAAPWTSEEELRFSLPLGARVESLPPELQLAGRFGSASLRAEANGGELRISSRVQLHATRIAAADYPAFREFCLEIERALRQNVRVVLARR